jgi:hypothetical protein
VKKRPIERAFPVAVVSAILLCLGLFPFPGIGEPLLKWALKTLFERYTSYYPVHWIPVGYLLILGMLFLAVKIILSKSRFLLRWRNRVGSLREIGKKSKKWIPVVFAICASLAVLLFFFTPFPFAFAYTSLFILLSFYGFRRERKIFFSLAFVVIVLFWSVYLFQGQDSHVKIFDSLDSHFAQSKVLADSGKAFRLNPETRLDQFINGLPLASIDSGFNVLTWLMIVFPPFAAFALNDLLIRIFAFLGMFLFLRRYVIKENKESGFWIVTGAALCFAFLPFYPAAGLSIAGFPLLLHSFLNIRNHEQRITDFLILLFIPFYSKLALAGFFFILIFGGIFIFDCIRKKRFNFLLAGAMCLLAAAYAFTHFHLVYALFSPDYVSFREELMPRGVPAAQAMGETLHNFIFDRVNVVGAQHLFITAAAVLAMLAGFLKKIRIKNLLLFMSAALLTSLMWGFKYWEGILPLREKIPFLNAFDFSRFYWLNPFLWSVIFALALFTISKIKYGSSLLFFFLAFQLLFLSTHYHWEYRYLLDVKKSLAGSPLTYSLTFREFYSESLFEEIDLYINSPKKDYRVVSIGIHPAIASFNGFYALDVYTDFYPLEYKHEFRKIIARELEKSPQQREGFDTNAKRCYVLVSELHGDDNVRGRAFARGLTKADQQLKIKNLELNTGVLKEMGGRYIFSAVEILNFNENGLSFEGIFERDDSPWKVHLYKVL